MQKLKLEDIRIDGGTQMRVSINQDVVADYREKMEQGEKMPPVVVYFDGSEYWLADGFHRFHSARAANLKSIDAELTNGTQRDAILHAVGANGQHGLLRSNEDKRRAVALMLKDEEWSKWSDRKIAKACGVSQPFVSSERNPKPKKSSQGDNGYHPAPSEVVTVTTPTPAAAISITPDPDDIPDDPIEVVPPVPRDPTPGDHRAAHNGPIQAAIEHLEADAKAISIGIGHVNNSSDHQMTNPESKRLSSWSGTVGLLRETAKGLKANLIVEDPSKPGQYVLASSAQRIKALAKK